MKTENFLRDVAKQGNTIATVNTVEKEIL